MPEDRVCPDCGAWFCRADDAWCGYCGAACAQLELRVRPSVLHVGLRPPRLYCMLTNPSCAEVTVGRVETPDWISLGTEDFGKLGPGASYVFLAQAHTEAMREPQAGELVVRTPVGSVAAQVMVIEERPAVIVVPERIEVWSGGGRNKSAVTVRPRAGMLRVRGVQLLGVPGEDVAPVMIEGGFVASPERGAAAALEVDGSRLSRGLVKARLRVMFDGPHGPESVELPVAVLVRRPPQLLWAGEHERPEVRFQTDRQRLTFVFRNQSPDGRDGGAENADLVITAIGLTPPFRSGIGVQLLSSLPARVAGGGAHTAEFELNLEQLRGEGSRFVEFALTVETNLPKLSRTVSVRVVPMPRYEGVVAIDFGSNNTCCAVFEPGGEPELLALDGENLVSPTVVRYVDMTRSPPVIETGLRVERAAAESEEVAASVADGLKQRLRVRRQEIDIRPSHPKKWMTRKASEAAADYLRDLRHAAEIRKSAVFREFILTHPARCPQRQHRRLRQALVEAFGLDDDRVSYLSEPIAALIPLIVKRASAGGLGSYTVASFDLGGGTTDVALVRVEYAMPAEGELEIRPAILYCTGANFGGEDLTAYVKGQLEGSCEKFLRSKDAGATLIVEHGDGAAALDVRRNRATLRDAAEQFKAHLSEEGAAQEPGQMILRVKQRDGRAADYPFDFGAVSRQGGRDLKRIFLAYTKERVQEVAAMLQEAVSAGGAPLDVIQLSGKTAFLAVVGEAMGEMFPAVEIVRADDPKECVVKGAYLSRSMAQGAVRLVLPDATQRMTSTLGVFAPMTAYFLPMLRADAVVPAEGLVGEVAEFWDGAGAVVVWESVGGGESRVAYGAAGKELEKLGTWEPERGVDVGATRWGLRLAMKGFELAVGAVGPGGEYVGFRPMNETGG